MDKRWASNPRNYDDYILEITLALHSRIEVKVLREEVLGVIDRPLASNITKYGQSIYGNYESLRIVQEYIYEALGETVPILVPERPLLLIVIDSPGEYADENYVIDRDGFEGTQEQWDGLIEFQRRSGWITSDDLYFILEESIDTEEVKIITEGADYDRVFNVSVKDWYLSEYPEDDCGILLDPDVTFSDIMKTLIRGDDFYDRIGFGDSLIRERIFRKLVELENSMGYEITYADIYDLWLANAI